MEKGIFVNFLMSEPDSLLESSYFLQGSYVNICNAFQLEQLLVVVSTSWYCRSRTHSFMHHTNY